MAAGTSSLLLRDSGAQRAPSARVALQRPEGAANSASIRADQPVLTANPTYLGKGCSADTPCPLATLLASSGAPVHAKCRGCSKDCAQPHSLTSAPVGIFLEVPRAQQQTPGWTARPPPQSSKGPVRLAVPVLRAERAHCPRLCAAPQLSRPRLRTISPAPASAEAPPPASSLHTSKA